jgi:3-hydroxy-3-methylglutaryl CoA synthase
MIGITNYGGYLPKRRMDKMTIAQSGAWYAPELFKWARGERTISNVDEDTITMAVEAAMDNVVGSDRSAIDAIYFASTTFPFADRDNAEIIRCALNLNKEVFTADFAASLKAGATALITALDAVKGGGKKKVLVLSSDHRQARFANAGQICFGDGASALTIGDKDVVAEFIGSYSIRDNIMDHYRGGKNKYDVNWEERFGRDMGTNVIYPEVLKGLLKKTGVAANQITKVVFPCIFGDKVMAGLLKKAGMNPESLGDNMFSSVGDCGAAMPGILLAKELETAKSGDILVVAGYGQGADALMFKVTDKISDVKPRTGVNGFVKFKIKDDNYLRWLAFNEQVDIDFGARADANVKANLSAHYRNHKFILGFVGSICTACGTPQLPPGRVCVNPKCGAIDKIEDYPFAERPATVFTSTTNTLTSSLQRPVPLGCIEFVGGGRFNMSYTDCEPGELDLGDPVRMTFRVQWQEERGFTAYFWKAAPVIKIA